MQAKYIYLLTGRLRLIMR